MVGCGKEGAWEGGEGVCPAGGHRPWSSVPAPPHSFPLGFFSKVRLPTTLLKALVTVGAAGTVAVASLACGRMGDPQAASRGHGRG